MLPLINTTIKIRTRTGVKNASRVLSVNKLDYQLKAHTYSICESSSNDPRVALRSVWSVFGEPGAVAQLRSLPYTITDTPLMVSGVWMVNNESVRGSADSRSYNDDDFFERLENR